MSKSPRILTIADNMDLILSSFVLLFQPLMKRFQVALQKHLEKQNEKVSLALKELVRMHVFLLFFCFFPIYIIHLFKKWMDEIVNI